jgi:hypothetical protein
LQDCVSGRFFVDVAYWENLRTSKTRGFASSGHDMLGF